MPQDQRDQKEVGDRAEGQTNQLRVEECSGQCARLSPCRILFRPTEQLNARFAGPITIN
jgi:hypothetical protein